MSKRICTRVEEHNTKLGNIPDAVWLYLAPLLELTDYANMACSCHFLEALFSLNLDTRRGKPVSKLIKQWREVELEDNQINIARHLTKHTPLLKSLTLRRSSTSSQLLVLPDHLPRRLQHLKVRISDYILPLQLIKALLPCLQELRSLKLTFSLWDKEKSLIDEQLFLFDPQVFKKLKTLEILTTGQGIINRWMKHYQFVAWLKWMPHLEQLSLRCNPEDYQIVKLLPLMLPRLKYLRLEYFYAQFSDLDLTSLHQLQTFIVRESCNVPVIHKYLLPPSITEIHISRAASFDSENPLPNLRRLELLLLGKEEFVYSLPLLSWLADCHQLEHLVIHWSSCSPVLYLSEYLSHLQDTVVWPQLKLFVITMNRDIFGWNALIQASPFMLMDVDEVPESTFYVIKQKRPDLHLWIRLIAFEYNSHSYGTDNNLYMSQEDEKGWRPFLEYDLPQPHTMQMYCKADINVNENEGDDL